jgi:hypothetical protein
MYCLLRISGASAPLEPSYLGLALSGVSSANRSNSFPYQILSALQLKGLHPAFESHNSVLFMQQGQLTLNPVFSGSAVASIR